MLLRGATWCPECPWVCCEMPAGSGQGWHCPAKVMVLCTCAMCAPEGFCMSGRAKGIEIGSLAQYVAIWAVAQPRPWSLCCVCQWCCQGHCPSCLLGRHAAVGEFKLDLALKQVLTVVQLVVGEFELGWGCCNMIARDRHVTVCCLSIGGAATALWQCARHAVGWIQMDQDAYYTWPEHYGVL